MFESHTYLDIHEEGKGDGGTDPPSRRRRLSRGVGGGSRKKLASSLAEQVYLQTHTIIGNRVTVLVLGSEEATPEECADLSLQ